MNKGPCFNSAFEPDLRLARWRFKDLAKLVDADYFGRIGPVRAAWSAMEQRTLARQADRETEALRLWQADPDSAWAYLTRDCAELAAEALKSAVSAAIRFRN